MNYYSIDFKIVKDCGFRLSGIPDDEGDGGFFAAHLKLETDLTEAGFCVAHEYGWSDGSTYKFIRTELALKEMQSSVDAALEKVDSPFRIRETRTLVKPPTPEFDLDSCQAKRELEVRGQYYEEMLDRFAQIDFWALQPEETKALPLCTRIALFEKWKKEQNKAS